MQADLKRVISRAITEAKRSIFLQIYSLTDSDLIALLEKKRAEGLDVKVFYDPTASKKSLLSFAQPLRAKGLMHKKILVIDEQKCYFGTANLTPTSLHFHDNVMVGINSTPLAKHLSHSQTGCGLFSFGGMQMETYLLPDPKAVALSRLCQCLDEAKEEICLAMFTLTHPRIIAALASAAKRGVKVSIASDFYAGKGASKGALARLQEAGAKITLSRGPELLHHKWAWIDRKIFVVGSANWTRAAFEKNQDILCIIRNLSLSDRKKIDRLFRLLAKQGKSE